VFNECLTEDEFIHVLYNEESVNKTNFAVNETNVAVNELNNNNNFQKYQSIVEKTKTKTNNFSLKETNYDKWEILNFKFDNMTREEKFDKRGLILYLEIRRLIEILEKIKPSLVNSWLQFFIDSTDINDNKLQIEKFHSFIYDYLIPIQKSSLVFVP
ncbi:2019_t:CDS:1, partial [Racocetra fulgida]